MLKGKKVILAVSGSISAYKAAFIIRLLIKSEALVKVIMTDASENFITPLTLGTLSKNPIIKDFTRNQESGEWNNHVELGLWADVMLIAPATANTISKMVTGHADSFLMATYLSAKCPVFIAPAMDLDMYKHGSTQDNLDILIKRNNHIIFPENGELASGLIGEGRLAEPEHIIEYLHNYFQSKLTLSGKSILITAGPTYEAIDPVRFIGNHSSGKMGIAIAEEALSRGALVTLITGPIQLPVPKGLYCHIQVTSAAEMLNACKEHYKDQFAIIMSAAVADYTPMEVAKDKLKKKEHSWTLNLKKTEDILKWLGDHKSNQILVGFALETSNEIENAQKKLKSKNLDFIVLNSLSDAGAGFQSETNKITLIDNNNNITNFELKLKSDVAIDILNKLENL